MNILLIVFDLSCSYYINDTHTVGDRKASLDMYLAVQYLTSKSLTAEIHLSPPHSRQVLTSYSTIGGSILHDSRDSKTPSGVQEAGAFLPDDDGDVVLQVILKRLS